jgi:hypothetical protein
MTRSVTNEFIQFENKCCLHQPIKPVVATGGFLDSKFELFSIIFP